MSDSDKQKQEDKIQAQETSEKVEIADLENLNEEELRDKVEELREQIRNLALTIDEVEDEKQVVENKWKKAIADYQNLEKSIDKRVIIKTESLKRKFASKIIEVVDDTKFAIDAAEDLEVDGEIKSWLEGIMSTVQKMDSALQELEVEVVRAEQGDEYDSDFMEAIAVVPQGAEHNQVVEMIQPGYKIGDKVIRSMRVVVCKKED